MNVPEGMKVFSGGHKYKAGEQLPAHIAKALEKKLNKKVSVKMPASTANKDSDK